MKRLVEEGKKITEKKNCMHLRIYLVVMGLRHVFTKDLQGFTYLGKEKKTVSGTSIAGN